MTHDIKRLQIVKIIVKLWILLSIVSMLQYAYKPELVAYETTDHEWQYSKDDSLAMTCRQGHKGILTKYRRFYCLQP